MVGDPGKETVKMTERASIEVSQPKTAVHRAVTGAANHLRPFRKGLVVIGALMVLATFFVKEGIREDLKSELSLIASARSEFTRRQEHEVVLSRISELEGRMTQRGSPGPTGTETSLKLTEKQYWDFLEPVMNTDWQQTMDEATVLIEPLAPNKQVETAKRTAAAKLESLGEQHNKVVSSFAFSAPDFATKLATSEQVGLGGMYTLMSSEAGDAAYAYLSSALSYASDEQEKGKKRMEFFTALLYALFTFGVVINVVGSLLEPEPKMEVRTE